MATMIDEKLNIKFQKAVLDLQLIVIGSSGYRVESLVSLESP